MSIQHPWEKQWKVESALGKGRQGLTRQVVSLSDPTKRGVLKKLLNNRSPQARRRMHQEVTSLKILASAGVKVPHVLDGNTHEYENDEIELYFVMEKVAGRMLQEEVQARGGHLPLEQAVKITLDLCGTVGSAHAENVLHRDVKPDNIIMRDFDKADAMIVDFGLSFNEVGEDSITQTGENFGNKFLSLPETNSPDGDRRDKRSDITAVCGIFYFCLTGSIPGQLVNERSQPPHKRPSHSTREALANDPRRDRVDTILTKGFAVAIEDRFQTLEELEGRLKALLSETKERQDPRKRAAELSTMLRRESRKIQLLSFQKAAQQLEQNIYEYVRTQSGNLDQFVPGLGGTSFDKALPDGIERVYDISAALTLGVTGHEIHEAVKFVVGAKGNECALLRLFLRGPGTGAQGRLGEWEIVDWYDPTTPPSAERVAEWVDDALNVLIDRLVEAVRAEASAAERRP